MGPPGPRGVAPPHGSAHDWLKNEGRLSSSPTGPVAATMPSRWNLGNDIVDLADPRHLGKAGDERFMQRVFSEQEREDILSSENPDRALWVRWAAKEAAFKTVSKTLGAPPTFIHPLYQVTLFRRTDPTSEKMVLPSPPMTRFGQVRHNDVLLPLRVEVADSALHAVTWTPSPSEAAPPFCWKSTEIRGKDESWRKTLRPEFSPAEWDCISHRASALGRLAARRSLASALGVDESRLEMVCGAGQPGRRIPKVLLEGREIPVDLTLSHHGRLLAWAFLTSADLSLRA